MKEVILKIPDGILADNLRQLVIDSGISVRAFSRKIHRPHKTVLTWINGEHSMRADDLKLICQTYNLSADELLGLRGKRNV